MTLFQGGTHIIGEKAEPRGSPPAAGAGSRFRDRMHLGKVFILRQRKAWLFLQKINRMDMWAFVKLSRFAFFKMGDGGQIEGWTVLFDMNEWISFPSVDMVEFHQLMVCT